MLEDMEDGDEFEVHDSGRRSIEGLSELVAEIRSLVEAQRVNAAADMDRSEVQAQLIAAVQKLASRGGGQGMSQSVLEGLVEQLADRPHPEPNPVYVFEIERNLTTGLIQKIVATPNPAG